MRKERKYILGLIVFFALADLIVHLATNAYYGLHRDEYLYIAMTDHPAFGYFSIPPFTPFMAKLGGWIWGHTVFGYRFFPSLSGALTMALTGLMVVEMGGSYLAVIMACLAYLFSPAYLHTNFLLMPVTFDIFFWTLLLYMLLYMIRSDDPRALLLMGATAGIALLNKYSIGFLVLGIVAAMLLTPYRKYLFSKYLWIALILGILIFLPNLIWQYEHRFPVFYHMSELYKSQLIHVSIRNFITDQLLMNIHALPVWIFALLFVFLNRKGASLRIAGLVYLAVILFFIIARGKGYYSLGLYPFLFALGGFGIESLGRTRAVYVTVTFLLMLILAVPALPFGLPVLSPKAMVSYGAHATQWMGDGLLRWEDGKAHPLPQDWADMQGWKELSQIVKKTFNSLDTGARKQCDIFAGNYGEAGAIKFFDRDSGMPEPISFNDAFLFWAPDHLNCRHLIYVDGDTTRIHNLFGKIQRVGSIQDVYAREYGLPVYLCSQPKKGADRIYTKALSELRMEFYR